MKLWIDDVRPAPDGYVWCKSVNKASTCFLNRFAYIDEISLDHDAGDYRDDGGDYIKFLDFVEYLQYEEKLDMSNIVFNIHSMNPVGIENMRRIIQRNGWKEV